MWVVTLFSKDKGKGESSVHSDERAGTNVFFDLLRKMFERGEQVDSVQDETYKMQSGSWLKIFKRED